MVEVEGMCVLDLFAGSGAFAIEALSRGAAEIHLIEREAACARAIRHNLTQLEIAERAHLHIGAVRNVLAGLQLGCDLAFADPPYDSAALLGLHAAIRPLMNDGGVLILEFASRAPSPELPGGWERLTSRRYGASAIVVDRLES
jgi:16S rRNA (guanine966-N2)-methyltransferase